MGTVLTMLVTVFVLAGVTLAFDDEANESCEVADQYNVRNLMNRMESVEKKLLSMNHLADRIEKLSKMTFELSRNNGAAVEKKLKMDVHYLEVVMGCLHQCFHSMETEEKRRMHNEVKRIEDMETTHACLHGCMHLH